MKFTSVRLMIWVLFAVACWSMSALVVGQVTNGLWQVTAAAQSQVLQVPAVAQMSVSIKNTSTGFAWVELTRPDGTKLEHRIDPNSSMTLFGKFTGVVVKYHVPKGSPAAAANGSWRIVGAPAAGAVLEGSGTWYVDPKVNGTATIYSSDVKPPPATVVTVKNNGPRTVRLLVKLSNGKFLPRVALASGATFTIPTGIKNWPAGMTILEVIVEWAAGGRSTGTYTVSR